MSRCFLILSLCAAALSHSQELTPPEQKELIAALQAHRAAHPAMTADFTEERTTRLLTKPIISNGEVSFLAPNKFRRELRGNAPSTTVCNGSELWIYYPKFSEAEHYTLGAQQMFDDSLAALTAGLNFNGVEKFFRISAAREGSGHRVTLTPKSGSLKRLLTTLTVWLAADGVLQKTDAALPKGDRVVTTYKNVRSTKQSAAKFDFTPPPGTKVTTPLGR